MFATQPRYKVLEDKSAVTDEYHTLESSGSGSDDSNHDRGPPKKALIVFIKLLLFCLSGLLLLVSLRYFSMMQSRVSNDLLRRTYFYSPIFDKVDISLSTLRVNGSFLNTHPPSIYRQDPSPEVDAAWDRISKTGTMGISSEEVRKLGKDPSKTAKYPTEYGLGPDAHIASIDVFHQVHCLDYLRKEIHFDYYYGAQHPNGQRTEAFKTHTQHCIYLLLQSIMCHADVDMYTHRWVDVQKSPLPDFSIYKQCRDFEAILQYRDAHDVDYAEIRKPVDVVPERAPPEFKDLFGQWRYVHNDVDGYEQAEEEERGSG